jgi:hypothetical protein
VTDGSINPGEITVAKAIERYFNLALYLLVLSGFGALASTGGLDLPAVILVGFTSWSTLPTTSFFREAF